MSLFSTRFLTAMGLLALCAQPTLADKIIRTDGKVISDVRVTKDDLTAVTYKKGNKTENIASEKVLRIEFEKYPRLVDEAEAALVGNDVETAVEIFDEYVEGQISKPNEKRYPWAPAYACFRSLEIRMANADAPGVVARAQQLIQNFPESRLVPQAYLAKSSAESMMGDPAKAKKTLDGLASIVQSKNLSRRWDVECRLGLIINDASLNPEAQREQLGELSSDAAEFPTVRNRILVAEGESFVTEAIKNEAKRQDLLNEAESVFNQILKRRKECDSRTLAGAYTGLGDVAYYAAGEDKDQLAAARMLYLRVVIVYADEVQYVPRCMFQAMLASNALDDTKKKRDMRRELMRLYPNSPYAEKAKPYK